MTPHDTFDAWKQQALDLALRRGAQASQDGTALDPATIVPATEEMAPATPLDVVRWYGALLLRWQELTTQQRAYEAELTDLQATGAYLDQVWTVFVDEHQRCLSQLTALDVPLDAVIRAVATLVKTQVVALTGRFRQYAGPLPPELAAFLEPLALHPRGQVPGKMTEIP